jgi:ABC-2 type transport system permease protein
MPGWLRVLPRINPLSYAVDALRGMLIGTHAHVLLDFGVMLFAVVLGIITASSLVSRPAR